MTNKIQVRRGTAPEWVAANPILSSGEIGLNTTTGEYKFGNGATPWASLVRPYVAGPNAPAPTGNSVVDTIALQAFVDGTTSGDTVHFGNYLWNLEDTLAIPAERHYVGTMMRNAVGSGFKAANGANLDAVVASSLWFSASVTPTSATPIVFEYFYIDGNKSNQTAGAGHGFVTMNFQSQFQFIITQSTRGDGIRGTGETLAGNDITNTANEMSFYRCQVRSPDGIGIHIHESDNTGRCTDGKIDWCIVSSSLEDGIKIVDSAGWVVGGGTHVYGCQKNGIHLTRPYRSTVDNCYVESYGDSATPGSYAGINMGGLSYMLGGTGPGNIVSHNRITASDVVDVGTSLYGIWSRAVAGQTAHCIYSDNQVYGRACTIPSIGIALTNQDATATAYWTEVNNDVFNWDRAADASPTGTTFVRHTTGAGQTRLAATTFSATPTITPAMVALEGGNQWQMTLTANVTAQTFTAGLDGQIMQLTYIQDATGTRTVAAPANAVNWPTITTGNGAVTNVTVQYRGARAVWDVTAVR